MDTSDRQLSAFDARQVHAWKATAADPQVWSRFTETGQAFTLTGSIGSKASCLAFLAGLAAGAFIAPSDLPSLLAGTLEGTAGAASTIVAAAAAGTAVTRTGFVLLYLCRYRHRFWNMTCICTKFRLTACSCSGASYSKLMHTS